MKSKNQKYKATIRYRDIADEATKFSHHTFTFNSDAHDTPLGQAWLYAQEHYGSRVRGVTLFPSMEA